MLCLLQNYKISIQFCRHSFHIWHKSSLASEGVSHVMTSTVLGGFFPYLVQMITSTRSWVACDDLWPWPISFWLWIQYDSVVWVIMRRRGVSSKRRRSSCSSFTCHDRNRERELMAISLTLPNVKLHRSPILIQCDIRSQDSIHYMLSLKWLVWLWGFFWSGHWIEAFEDIKEKIFWLWKFTQDIFMW